MTGPARLEYLNSIFPDAKFINVVREPTATVNSLLNVPFWQEQGANQLWWTGAYSREEEAMFDSIKQDVVASTAFQLNKILTTTKQEIDRVNADVITVHYEDFIAKPTAVMNDLLTFCQLDSDRNITQKLDSCQWHNRNNQGKPGELHSKVSQWCSPLSF
ncbi:sulfotransferase [Vibrio sonorensis]|uniref:sulfotransferase n=1 Tax=Vibrio sonorensis TaxID=1004316 RepID=UPI001585F0D8|nr:sulfotransferase [Vibrio sonorensis]